MLKGSGTTKSIRRKWNPLPTIGQDSPSSSKASSSSSFDELDDDVHFVLDNNNFSFLKPPVDKSTIPQKTYSKKKPVIIQPFVPRSGMEVFEDNILAKTKTSSIINPKCLPASKVTVKKRKRESDPGVKSLVSRKAQKRVLPKSTPKSCSAKVPRQPRSKSLEYTEVKKEDSDTDIEIIEEVKFTKPYADGKSITLPVKRVVNHSTNKKAKKSFEAEVVTDSSMVINEADIAPFMPTNPNNYPDLGGANSMRWLTAKGQITYGGSCSFEDARTPQVEHQPTPEAKSKEQKKPSLPGELRKLYANLNEIKWAHESSFKNLLRDPDIVCSPETAGIRIAGSGKVLRKLKPAAVKTASSKTHFLSKRSNKVSGIGLKHKGRPVSVSVNKSRKVVKRVRFGKDSKKGPGISKTNVSNAVINEETDVFYQINPNPPLEKLEVPDKKLKVVKEKTKQDLSKLTTEDGKSKDETKKEKQTMLKLKTETQKPKPSILKLKPDVTKAKANVLKMKFEEPKFTSLRLKQDDESTKKSSCLEVIKPEDSCPSTSGSQMIPYKEKSSSKNCSKSSDAKSLMTKVDNNFDFTKEMQLFRGLMGENDNMYSAVQKGSKLRVKLQPLEHTDLWTSEFYEDVRKHFLDQALRKALENRDRDSITVMYQDLLESFMSSQASNSKKKKHEEEALRVSVRQSEGAFRYKEIVVKRHPNYMQVVLVPNDVKQNSLTIEAMKELKDALLLAKKDPNCHAVLLNSSGTYFCTGVDLSPLIGSNKKQAAEDLSNSIRDLVMTLGLFTKPVIAAVNGVTIGFGVSLLTYCDVVLASDKATFYLPATKLGYIPEGGVTLTLPQVVGSSVASEMFLQGRRLTAEQAFRYGLVSEVLWPTKLMNEVIPRLKTIISQPLQAMEATKAMVRCHLWDKLKSHVDRERRLLCEHWLGAQCQANIKAHLQTGWMAD